MNISIALADSSKTYVERLSEGLQQYDELAIHVYTSERTLREAMEKTRFDVVLFDPDLSEETLSFPGVKLPVCLYSDESGNMERYAEFAKVQKYQRISHIYKEIIREYADKAGYTVHADRSGNTEMIAFYSPAGGAGKTTAALAAASQLAAQGSKVLFVSLEQLNSSFCVHPKKEDGLIALIESSKDAGVNFELKLKSVAKQGMNGVYYIEGFDRLADYDAVSEEEAQTVLQNIRKCGICDFLIVDMESGLNPVNRMVIQMADRVMIVEKPGELPAEKMRLFAGQAFANEHQQKMALICNFAESNSRFSRALDVPAAGMIHNYGNLPLKQVIDAIRKNGEIDADIMRKGRK